MNTVLQIVMREPCRWCLKDGVPHMNGVMRNVNGQNVVRCTRCERQCYNAPKSETGESQRVVKSRPDLPGGARDFVLKRANHRCELCGQGTDTAILHVAHALSVADCKSQGVPEELWHDEANLVCACEECNLDMGARSLEPRQMARLLVARLRRGKQT